MAVDIGVPGVGCRGRGTEGGAGEGEGAGEAMAEAEVGAGLPEGDGYGAHFSGNVGWSRMEIGMDRTKEKLKLG